MEYINSTNSFLPFCSAVLVACSSKAHDKEIRKLKETLPIQYNIICFVYVLKHISQLEMREKKVWLLERISSFYLFKTGFLKCHWKVIMELDFQLRFWNRRVQ